MKRAYEIRFTYTRRGLGVGIALYQYKPFSYFGGGMFSDPRLATMAFMQEGETLLTADGDPHGGLDSGYNADDWHSVKQLMYEDSPDDGTIEDMLNDEYPGLLDQVREVLRNHRSQRLTPDGKVIKIPKRAARDSDGAYVAKLIRAFNGLPLRGKDEVGHVVNIHKSEGDRRLQSVWNDYDWTINYETRSWVDDFIDWYEELTYGSDDLPDIESLSSYEIGILRA